MDRNPRNWFEAVSKGDLEEVRKILEENPRIINACDVS